MFRKRLVHISLALGLVMLSLVALAFATTAQSNDEMSMTIEIAGDGNSFVMQEQPVNDEGAPLHGNPFIIRGYIYPEGTLTASNGILEDGSAEFPEQVIGTWICNGWFYGDSVGASTGPYAVTHQIFEFGATETGESSIMTYGFEMIDIDLPFNRSVMGGTGEYSAATGNQVQTYLGDNPSFGPNFRISFTLNDS